MYRSEVEALKAGDVVAILPGYAHRTTRYLTDAVVEKVNGHGHVIVKHRNLLLTFDRYGRERNQSITAGASLADNATAKSRNAAMAEQKALNEKVNAITDLLAKHKNGYNDYVNFSTEVKKNLLRMVGEL